MNRMIVLAVVTVLTVASCASDSTGDTLEEGLPVDDGTRAGATDTPIDPGDGIGDGTEGEDLPVVSPDLAEEVEAAIADLTGRIGDDTLIGVTSAFTLTWPDGSLGCPEPGMSYTQALVEGYRIELTADGATYAYHGALGQDPFLCEPGG